MGELLTTLSEATGIPPDVLAGWALILMAVVIGALAGLFDDVQRRD